MRRGASSIEWHTTAGLLLLVVITIALIAVSGFIAKAVAEQRGTVQCQVSQAVRETFDAAADAGIPGPTRGWGLNIFSLSCPREVIMVTDNKYVRLQREWFKTLSETSNYEYAYVKDDGTNDLDLEYVDEPQKDTYEEQMKQLLSYELAQCYWQFKEGQLDLTGSKGTWTNGRTCVVCTEIFSDVQQQPTTIDLLNYLNNTNRAWYGPDGTPAKETYYEYLYDNTPPAYSKDCAASHGPDNLKVLDQLQDIEIGKGSHQIIYFMRVGGTLSTLFQGRDREWCQTVGMSNYEDFMRTCEVIVN